MSITNLMLGGALPLASQGGLIPNLNRRSYRPVQPGGGGMASLLGNPLFGAGMGLLGAGFDRRVNPANAAMQGLQGASYYQNAALDRQRQEELYRMRMQQHQQQQADRARQTQARETIAGTFKSPEGQAAAQLDPLGAMQDRSSRRAAATAEDTRLSERAEERGWEISDVESRRQHELAVRNLEAGLAEAKERRKGMVDAAGQGLATQNMAELIYSEDFDDSVGLVEGSGLGQVHKRIMGGILDPIVGTDFTEDANRTLSAQRQVGSLLIADLEKMGARPTDKDMEELKRTMPSTLQDAAVWRGWFENEYLPVYTTRYQAKFGTPPPNLGEIQATMTLKGDDSAIDALVKKHAGP